MSSPYAKNGVRFAPSPTGRFHIGNLRTAWISRLWSQALGLPWVVRFEDIDEPRVLMGAMETQLSDMKALGLEPDEVLIQSERHERHRDLFEKAVRQGAVYSCTCSRREVQQALSELASAPHSAGAVYNGACREPAAETGKSPGSAEGQLVGWRLRASDPTGAKDFLIARTSLDRKLFVPSYHWACAIDDFDGGYELLVRASDLASAAEQQRAIQSLLNSWEPSPGPLPAVFHTSLVVQNDGHRLEKRTRGITLPELETRGFSPGELLKRFEASFRLPREEYAPSRIWGEKASSITLQELGIEG